jgi:hypothetical protein
MKTGMADSSSLRDILVASARLNIGADNGHPTPTSLDAGAIS